MSRRPPDRDYLAPVEELIDATHARPIVYVPLKHAMTHTTTARVLAALLAAGEPNGVTR